MKLRFSPIAADDLENIADYIGAESPQGARRVRAAILRSLDIVTHFPRIGRPQSVPGVRKLVTRRYGYLIYYLLDDAAAEIVVLTIQHPARERPMADR